MMRKWSRKELDEYCREMNRLGRLVGKRFVLDPEKVAASVKEPRAALAATKQEAGNGE